MNETNCELCPPERPGLALPGDILCRRHSISFDPNRPNSEVLQVKIVDAEFLRKNFQSSLGEARR